MNKIVASFLCLFVSLVLLSCNPPGSRDELRAKSSARADIIERSGTQIIDEKDALIDAENRLRTGGGLFGTKPSSLDMFTPGNNKQQTSSIGFPINPALWRGSLEVLEFMPLASADPFGGIIITDWYSDNKNVSEKACRKSTI